MKFRINKNGVNPVPEKVVDLFNAETPKNNTQLKWILGMLSYYHSYQRHLPNLADIAEPLQKLLSKISKWNWGREHKQCFEKIKEILCSPK